MALFPGISIALFRGIGYLDLGLGLYIYFFRALFPTNTCLFVGRVVNTLQQARLAVPL